jgi:transposase-like protein
VISRHNSDRFTRSNAPAGTVDAAAPADCPFCRSKNLQTTSKVTDGDNYWRCMTCGEIWNPARVARPSRGYR